MPDTILRVPGGAQQEAAPRGTPSSNDVKLTINGKIWSGWTAVRIGRGVERFPSDFEVALTERYPGEAGTLLVEAGQACVLKIGNDLIITGAIDRYTPAITPTGHEVRIHGRSLCRALVDCSAGVLADDSFSAIFASQTALGTIQQIVKPLGITVTSTADAAQAIIPQIVLNLGETAAEVIDRICRWAGLLYYDTPDGNMVLAQVGTGKAASGFQQGVNVEAAGATFSADQRYSDYIVVWMSSAGLVVNRADLPDGSTNGNSRTIQKDTSQPGIGFRPHVIVCEQVDQSSDFGMRRAVWEMNRRNGRSRAVTLTTDTWRDSAGKLWTPNTLVTVSLPILKITSEQWVIGEVTYRRDEAGTHADLTLMPPEAYQPEPFNLRPIDWQTQQALREGGAQKETPAPYDPGRVPRGDR